MYVFKEGRRVRVASHHLWMPNRCGTIKKVQDKTGNRFLVRFDRYEQGMWHDEDGDPVLQLGEKDLILSEQPEEPMEVAA